MGHGRISPRITDAERKKEKKKERKK